MDKIMSVKMAYMAGLIDGEGHIGIKSDSTKKQYRTYYYERISIANTCKEVVDMFSGEFGGYVYLHKPSKLSDNSYWTWEVTNTKARIAISKLMPYLVVKKHEAEMVTLLSDNKIKKYDIIPDDIQEYRKHLFDDIKLLRKNQYKGVLCA